MNAWTPKAELYDYGRPFPAERVAALFAAFAGDQRDRPLSVLEPGCGTGRVLIPLAGACPGWRFLGIDSAASAVEVCRTRCAVHGLLNVALRVGSVEQDIPDRPFDLIVHSSLLHVVPEWPRVMSELCVRLRQDGVFCLIGDDGDLYDLALGRPCEFFFLGLRKTEGLSLSDFEARFRASPEAFFPGTIDRMVEDGLLLCEGDRVRLSPRGFMLADSVMQQFAAPKRGMGRGTRT